MNARLPCINVWKIIRGLHCKRSIELSLPPRCPKLENSVVRGKFYENIPQSYHYVDFWMKIFSKRSTLFIYNSQIKVLQDMNHLYFVKWKIQINFYTYKSMTWIGNYVWLIWLDVELHIFHWILMFVCWCDEN